MKLEQIEDEYFNFDLITSITKYYDGPRIKESESGILEPDESQLWKITFAGGDSIVVSDEKHNEILKIIQP